MPPKFKSKFIQQYHILPTLPKFMNRHHCSSYTMPKNSTIQNSTKPTLQHDQTLQCPKFQQKKTTIKMTMSQHQTCNKTWKQKICQQRNKKKLGLKSILERGAWVLGSWRSPSSSFHSSDGWFFFPWKVRKKGLLEDDAICAKKKEV